MFHRVASFHPHYLTFTPQTYHHPVHRFRSWSTQTTSQSHPHTQVRVQPRNTYNHTYNHTYIKCLDTTKQPHTKSRQNNLHSVHTRPCRIYNLDLTINNKALPMATLPKVMGLTLDPKLKYSTHIHNISVQVHKPLQIIKALTATGWGKQKETLMATYKAVMRPALEYVSSVWCCCCLPTPMTLASGWSPMFPLVVHQPASPSIWPAVQSLRRGLSTNPGATMWCVCGCS